MVKISIGAGPIGHGRVRAPTFKNGLARGTPSEKEQQYRNSKILPIKTGQKVDTYQSRFLVQTAIV